MTKELQCVLVVSDDVVRHSGLDFSDFNSQQVSLRGKQQSILIFAIRNPLDIRVNG